MEIQSVTMIGMGAVGALIGSQLTKSLGRENVQCIASGERKARYEKDGLYLNGEKQDYRFVEPADATVTDLVIIATKNLQLEEAVSSIKKAVGSKTVIMSLLNGIQSEKDIAAVYGKEHMLYSFVLSLNSIHEKNRIEYSNPGKVIFGEEDNSKSERIEGVCRLFDKAGIKYLVPSDMQLELWKKYLINVTFNTLSALCRSPYGGFTIPVMQELARATGSEVIAVANAEGVALTPEMLENDIMMMCSHDPHGKTSMLQDMEAGRKSENAWFCGTVVRLGAKHGIKTPVCGLLEKLVEGTESVRSI
jgi:2-dehydropantoate 2-reductase